MKKHLPSFSLYAFLVFISVALLIYGFLGTSFTTLSILHLALAGISLLLFFISKSKSDITLSGPNAKKVKKDFLYSILNNIFFLGIIIVSVLLTRTYLPTRFDFTEEKVFSLSSHTQKILSDLNNTVEVKLFSLGGEPPEKLRSLLDRYAKTSKNFRWTTLDPDTNRPLVERFGIHEKDTMHFSFIDQDLNEKSGILNKEHNEEGITNSLIKLSSGKDTIVYIPQSQGEGSINDITEIGFSFLKESIIGEGYKVSTIDFTNINTIPIKNSLVLFISPIKDYLPGEREKINEFLKNGGRAVFLLEPLYHNILEEFIVQFGIQAGKDTIVDKEALTFKDGVMGVQPLIDTFSKHPSVMDFRKTIILSTASSVKKQASADNTTELAFTSDSSWAETNLELLYSDTPIAEKTEEDLHGPVSIAAAFEEPDSSKNQRIVVIGDTDFLRNINIRQLFNRDFFLNLLNWTAGENEVVKIRAGTLRASRTIITPEQFGKIFTWSGVILPEIILLLGLWIWVKRK